MARMKPGDPKLDEYLRNVASGLDTIFNGKKRGKDRPTGFVLLVYPFNEFEKGDNRCNYISNGADRKDIVVLFKELIRRFEGAPDVTGHG